MPLILNKWRIFLSSCILSHFVIFSLLGIWRHWGYLTSPYDLGVFDQAIWTASQSGTLLNSINTGQTINWLGFHFQPILYLFVPLYKLYPSVHWLTLIQSAALSLSALPIFTIARHVTHSNKNAFIWAVIYLLNPFIMGAATWDFHEVSLATFLISWGLYAITQKRLLLLFISSALLLTCKEHYGLTVAGLGFVYGLVHKNWRLGAGFTVIGIMMMALIIGGLMPFYSPTGQHLMIKPISTMHSSSMRYSWLGNSLPDVIENLFKHPLMIIKTVFLARDGGRYLGALLAPFLLLPLASFGWLIPIGGDLLANLLSANPMPRNLSNYHSATMIPVLTVAAIHSLQQFASFLKKISTNFLLKSILLLNLVLAYLFLPLPLPGSLNYWQPVDTITFFDKRELLVKKLIENRTISVQSNLLPHFTQTSSFYIFPEKMNTADFIVLRLDSPTKRITPDDPDHLGTLAYHLGMSPTIYLNHIENLLNNKYFKPVYWDDPWIVLSKGQSQTVSSETLRQIRDKLLMTRKKWILKNDILDYSY